PGQRRRRPRGRPGAVRGGCADRTARRGRPAQPLPRLRAGHPVHPRHRHPGARRRGAGAPVVTARPPVDEAAQVRSRLASLRLPGIVDVHTHFMPQRVLDKVWAYFDSAGPLVGRPWPITYRTSEEERLATLRSLGVRAFPSLNYAHRPGMAAWLNEWSADFARQHADVLHSATFYPEPGAVEYTRAAIDAGTQVVKVHVQVGDFSLTDPLLDDVWAELEESGTPVVTHAGNGPAPGTFTGPEGVRELLRRHPDLVLVIAHMGLPD